MREIKFRVWDCRDNRMYHNVQWGIYVDPDENIDFEEVLGLNRYKIMQYTGIKDVKGERIYEGDILTYTSLNDKEKIIEVWYEDDWGTFSFGNKNLTYIRRTMKVIGNIYDNPELIEVR